MPAQGLDSSTHAAPCFRLGKGCAGAASKWHGIGQPSPSVVFPPCCTRRSDSQRGFGGSRTRPTVACRDKLPSLASVQTAGPLRTPYAADGKKRSGGACNEFQRGWALRALATGGESFVVTCGNPEQTWTVWKDPCGLAGTIGHYICALIALALAQSTFKTFTSHTQALSRFLPSSELSVCLSWHTLQSEGQMGPKWVKGCLCRDLRQCGG